MSVLATEGGAVCLQLGPNSRQWIYSSFPKPSGIDVKDLRGN